MSDEKPAVGLSKSPTAATSPPATHVPRLDGEPRALPFLPHTTDATKVLEALEADPRLGLAEDEVVRRLAEYGPNRIKPPPKANIWKIIFRQVANAMTVILSKWRAARGHAHHAHKHT